MSDRVAKPEREKSGVGAVVILLLVGLLPPLYVLGIGPAAWYVRRGNDPAIVDAIYAPVTWFYRNCEPVRPALNWYIELWK